MPAEFRKIAGSPRDRDADPWQAFRYDQDFEFIEAIHAGSPLRSRRSSTASDAQSVMAAIMRVGREQRTVDVPQL